MNAASNITRLTKTSPTTLAARTRTIQAKRRQQDSGAVTRLADRIIDRSRAEREAAKAAAPMLGRQQRRRDRLRRLELPTARDLEMEAGRAEVADPYSPGERIKVEVNRRVDILELERSHKRISEAAFLVGREVQATFERAQASGGGSNWTGGHRVDMELAKERRIIKGVDRAREVQAEMTRLTDGVGMIGARFLREVLAEGVTFADYAARRGRGGDRGTAYVAEHFRMLLEGLADFRAARGAVK